ncbi:ABC transporter ATP-binding protein [Azospirillum sp. RWY-5-1]|uniref:ABC transporter ATP-binding protein n=1 Tax=Azospirillum oleiclasticum TaxID=2735135 RepID=A0ABX2THH4_9PROT|nr:ABC transporter ATP-binding protein [Azospirillum oleiclasticum]NYZ15525.1 ABC transporter ATP-binding protein [Azospirillum oleiclasticum]NYZ22548.1 ABC transporter ATP-binding protein [Azospirillum oleiclasticum]
MTASQPVVDIQNISKRYGRTAALDRVSFELKRGECVALLGPSGCGKTTTLRILAGFERPDAGVVAIDGRDMSNARPYERNIGLVFQDYALFPHMTVAENVEYGMKRRGVPKAERERRRREVLRLVRLDGLDERRPSQLSGGQQQRVAMARALAPNPSVMLLDEPLSNLDARLRHDLRHELREILSAAGTTTLIVTHDQEEAIAMADRIVLMNHGRIQQIGPPRSLYERPENAFVASFLGRCNWFDGVVESALPDGSALFRTTEGLALRVRLPDPRVGAPAPSGVAVRPERLHVVEAGTELDGDFNRLPATVTRLHYLGADLRFDLTLPEGRRLEAVVKADGRPLPAPGDTVAVAVAPADCVPVAGDLPQ